MENKKNYYFGVLFMLFIFGSMQLYFHYFPDNNDPNELLYKKIKSRNIKSVVTRKSIDYSNHGAEYLVYERDSLPTLRSWNEKIEIGDSIFKPIGSLEIILIKKNNLIVTLNYNNIGDVILSTSF